MAAAGFVGTTSTAVTCFSCHCTLDMSDYRTRMYTAWALHAWSKEGFDCQHLMQKLR